MTLRYFVAALLGFLALPLLTQAEEPLPTFVLAGQSNMVGKRCQKDELPPELQKPNPNVLFYKPATKTWVPIEPGVTEAQGFGPEIAFGAAMAEKLGRPVGIIKHSKGGTNLHAQWDPKQPKSLYGQLTKIVQSAAESRPIEVVGMLWVQGGADAKSEVMSSAYSVNLQQLISQSRTDFGNPNMAFLSGRIPPKDTVKKPFWETVRNAQQDLEMENYAWVDCDAITVGPDNVHYDTPGMVLLGTKQAEIMAQMLSKATAAE